MKTLRFVPVGLLAILVSPSTFAFAGTASVGRLVTSEGPASLQSSQQGAPSREKTKPTQKGATKPADSPAEADPYLIGIEDELLISVWHEPELSMSVQVRPDGMITLPLVNDLPVVGMTTKELQSVLSEKLKPFVNEPQVTVIVRNIRSRKVYLAGQVSKPGPYTLNEKKTVLQLLTEAGGLGQFAKGGSIYIIRTVNGQQTHLKFNYKKALQGKPDSGDVELLPGDMVVVP